MTDTTNNDIPPRKAVALQWDGSNTAPRITAKGEGALAEEIVALAREYGVPLNDNPYLVDLLSQLELGTEIPETLYVAVAEIIAFAYYISGKTQPPSATNV